jgi:hypothetical protein
MEAMPNWLQAEDRRESLPAAIQQYEGFARELAYLRDLQHPEPWRQERRLLLEAGSDTDQQRLVELRQEQQWLHQARGRVLEAERIISRFANQHGIDAWALHRFIVWCNRAAAGDAVQALWTILDALDREPGATAPDAPNPPDDSHSDTPPTSTQDAIETPPVPTPSNLFARLPGKRYQIRFAGKEETVPMLVGLRVAEHLLKQPGKPAHVLEINRALYEGNPRAAAIEDAFARSEEPKGLEGFTTDASRPPDACSEEDLQNAKEAVESLDEQATRAREGGEHDKADELEGSADKGRQWIKEQEALQGRKRRGQPDQSSQVEKVRLKLTNNFTNACEALRTQYGLSELADHLEEQIDRGTDFKYRRVPGVEWAFDPTRR